MSTTKLRPRTAMLSDSPRFRESTHLIPTPGIQEDRPERYEPLILKGWVVSAIAVVMIGLGVALEAALSVSTKNDGYYVPPENVFKFACTQFLTSFIPTLFVAPLGYLWSVTDWMLRWYQPYVTLSKGEAPAEESILLDYIALKWGISLKSLIEALAYLHIGAHCDCCDIIATTRWIYLPSKTGRSNSNTIATTTTVVGLLPTVVQLNAFLASAGFADAAVYNHLPDPPFVYGEWASAEFLLPSQDLANGSVAVNTTAIQAEVNCANPASLSLSVLSGGNVSVSATSSDGCTKNLTLNSTDSEQQYGVVNVDNCPSSNTDPAFQPVMFWFFHTGVNPQAAGVFCRPSIGVFNVTTTTNLNDGSLTNVTIVSNYTSANNVTGSPLNGRAYNGVVFDPSSDTTIQARATAINSGVPGAIFRFATQLPNGPQPTFDAPNGFLDITYSVYTQHLALAAKSIYFIPTTGFAPAKLTSQVPRLLVEPLPAHALAVLLIVIGIIGLALHTIHRRLRRHLRLTSPPGSIAAIVSLTSRSGFGELLLPYDDEKSISQKLTGLTFRLDGRTGAIVSEDDGGGFKYHSDDVATTLFGKHDISYSNLTLDSPPFKMTAAEP
ncbi:hypothetical protein SERLA73DRAFT_75127 [Serpula lacrymans var. lacrymans S7.3]|uniref:Uncharacterized protein n=2 Tax=Serpula lacrymans var. lacrymans TaxID=341189 RepID=F8Q2N2_SERL3|nr:uncharacterized protein SERLADRAFT_439794 [Serpula lacrymans var. lacrymans S7.9]EGN97443.1 hypothetical protein SERLA73DRAFT_75127 [Serpula lacrymans var. lacrymans S7.3]EGO23035.1 hypothetical protein SERLADRAFT_439794 [Serpula lacrymans var. lacrymans S7.9]